MTTNTAKTCIEAFGLPTLPDHRTEFNIPGDGLYLVDFDIEGRLERYRWIDSNGKWRAKKFVVGARPSRLGHDAHIE